MAIIDIEHIELYVADAHAAADFYVARLGLRKLAVAGPETGLAGRRSVLLGHGGMRLVVTSALEPTGPVAEYVARHGDGVADIALRVEDAAAVFERVVGAGGKAVARPVTTRVAGHEVVRAVVEVVGNVRHSLIQRPEGLQRGWYEGFVALEAEPTPLPHGLLDFDHFALCLELGQLDPLVRFYQEVLGFRLSHTEYVETAASGMNSKVVESANGRVKFPMQEPIPGRPGQIDDFLAKHGGSGVQHVALLSDDIAAALRGLSARGMRFMTTPGSYYEMLGERVGRIDEDVEVLRSLNVLVDRDEWGYLLQIFAKSDHDRRTLFFEIIQRKDARGFGSANVRALFQAVEREQMRAAAS
ncbi:4-hydroxyphenylpyruvate dioxygenase [Archangium violaceum]|uniref:4-hydroxyphenylpyruvate dioxygenase n=1 Tax=Archangium violaceum TaxID=83451 RepID=UPI00194F6B03|nr:4-hydroxyphenylpyruvate dioxygenase [Archangium violaceum]QRO01828.1 4-hydroxyphenylpyruvate dioxygenase [Archangium violaceum]